MFRYIESAILTHPYRGEAWLAHERFGAACVRILSGKTFVSSGFLVTDQISFGCARPFSEPRVVLPNGANAPAKVDGEGPWAFLTSVEVPVPSWHFRQAQPGELVFCVGYRDSGYTVGWGEVSQRGTAITCDEQDATGSVIVSRSGLVLGLVYGWEDGRYQCVQIEGQLPKLSFQ